MKNAKLIVFTSTLLTLSFVNFYNTYKSSAKTYPLQERQALVFTPIPSSMTFTDEELQCMTENIYHEARNQKDDAGLAAIGYVVLNRVANPEYPNDVCSVIYQDCQFSWVCKFRNKPIAEKDAWERSKTIARQVLNRDIPNPIGTATRYHANYVTPNWNKYKVTIVIGDHIFYERDY